MNYEIMAPAKINIGLRVLGRRTDGYHDILSIMVPFSLFDTLWLSATDQEGIVMVCEGRGGVPADETNLAYRAAQSFQQKTGLTEGLLIRLNKNIPVAAGLGGGSSDAAATLLALNDIHNRPLTPEDLHRMALNLGADVPFFLQARPALARGIGEILDPIENWMKNWYVTVTPPLQVSTAWVYHQVNLGLTSAPDEDIFTPFRVEPTSISRVLVNDLEEITATRFPVIYTLKECLLGAGAEGAVMSGSGPTVFGIFATEDRARKAAVTIAEQNLGDVFVVTDWEMSQGLNPRSIVSATKALRH